MKIDYKKLGFKKRPRKPLPELTKKELVGLGISLRTAERYMLCMEYTKEYIAPPLERGVKLSGSLPVATHFSWLRQEKKEHFFTISLSADNKLIASNSVSIGSANTSVVHPREVFSDLILDGAISAVLVHNHPSGNSLPSKEDTSLTQRLIEAGKLMGINIVDHIIIGDEYFSFAEHKLCNL
jgi:DNA repair protein RadC